MSHNEKDDAVVVACNGSPMTIGLGQVGYDLCVLNSWPVGIHPPLTHTRTRTQGKTFIASEPAAFNRYTKNFIAMQVGICGVWRIL